MWAGWFCDSCRAPSVVRTLSSAFDLVLIADSGTATTLAGSGNPRYATSRRGATPRSTDPCARATDSAPTSCSPEPRRRIVNGSSPSWSSTDSRCGDPGGGGRSCGTIAGESCSLTRTTFEHMPEPRWPSTCHAGVRPTWRRGQAVIADSSSWRRSVYRRSWRTVPICTGTLVKGRRSWSHGPRPISARSRPRRCRIGRGRKRWRPVDGTARCPSIRTCTGWSSCCISRT